MASGATLWVALASSGEPPASGYATFGVRNNRFTLDFDTTSQESIYFTAMMPTSYANGGITVYLLWMAATATSGTIGWDVSIERMSDATTDMDADSFATAKTVTAATVPATSGVIATSSVSMTNGAEIDGVLGGELFRIRVRRDVANDTATGDAQLLAVEVRES